jgi:hypothetical protein
LRSLPKSITKLANLIELDLNDQTEYRIEFALWRYPPRATKLLQDIIGKIYKN